MQQSIATEKGKKKIVSKDAHADAENCAVSPFLLRLFLHFRPSTCKITSKCKRRDDERRRSFSFYILWQQQPDGNSSILYFIFTIECDNHLSWPSQTEEIPSSEVAAEKASSYTHTHTDRRSNRLCFIRTSFLSSSHDACLCHSRSLSMNIASFHVSTLLT